jgi:hypothetical protein
MVGVSVTVPGETLVTVEHPGLGEAAMALLAVEVVLPDPAAGEGALVVDLVVVVAPEVELPQAAQITATTSTTAPHHRRHLMAPPWLMSNRPLSRSVSALVNVYSKVARWSRQPGVPTPHRLSTLE